MNLNKILITAFVTTGSLFISCDEGLDEENPAVLEQRTEVPAQPTSSPELITNYKLSGLEGDPITLETARKWTQNFQAENPQGSRAHFFGSDILNQILAEEGCVGIRMYYALDDNGNRQILLVGVNASGENLIPASAKSLLADDNAIVDASFPCPSFCPPVDF